MSYGGKGSRKRGSGRRTLGGNAAVLLLGIVGTAAAAWGLGVEVPWLKKPPAAPNLAGMVQVPVLAEAVPAYTKLSREHFFNKKTGKLTYLFLSPKEIRPDMIVDFGKLLGRVTAREKRPAYVFTAADLAPEGTRPGIVGAVPAGKRSIVLDAGRISGLHGLAAGDRCDLLATLDPPPQPGSRRKGLVALPSGAVSTGEKRTVVLVQNGLVIKPVTLREPTKGVGKTPAAKGGVEEAVLAIAPAELAPLTEALSAGATVVCVARSGRPDDVDGGGHTPGSRQDRLHAIEVMVGFERDLFVAQEREVSTPPTPPGTAPPTIVPPQTAKVVPPHAAASPAPPPATETEVGE